MDHIFQFYTVLYSFSVLVEDPVLFAQTEKENVLLSTITVLGSLYSPNGGLLRLLGLSWWFYSLVI